MTSADAATARDHIKDAIALVKMLNAGQSADAQTLLDSYANDGNQFVLTGSLAMVATTLAVYIDKMAHDMAAVKPGYPVASSADVLTRLELLMSPADNGASDKSSRGEPIGYL
jgi:hypothetical protein